ncbi:hypothetical protein BDA96_10G029500 [Sorghum bicolor]|uniref:Uncharacterized protein n=1 Tax=Sorghum bicolor TaxID=4558 RepID=A0A921Q1A3_SORBI|nr:hypothetical protein BDA96_10G029500 [Sorghum bicolor]
MNHSDCFLSFSLLTHSNPTIRIACMVLVVAQPSASHKGTHISAHARHPREISQIVPAVPTAAMQFNKITVRPLPCANEITGAATVQSSEIVVPQPSCSPMSEIVVRPLHLSRCPVRPVYNRSRPYRLRDVRRPPPRSLFALAYVHPLCPSAAHREKHGRRRQGLADVLGLLDVLCMNIQKIDVVDTNLTQPDYDP